MFLRVFYVYNESIVIKEGLCYNESREVTVQNPYENIVGAKHQPNHEVVFAWVDYALPDGERAELIDGQIYYMATPGTNHQRLVHFFI